MNEGENSFLGEEPVGKLMASSGIGAFFGGRDYNGHSIQDELWGIQRQVIENIAEKEPSKQFGMDIEDIEKFVCSAVKKSLDDF